MNFYFKKPPLYHAFESVIFAKVDKIIEFNFVTGVITDKVIYKKALTMFPQIFLMNTYQNIMIIASEEDGIYYNADS